MSAWHLELANVQELLLPVPARGRGRLAPLRPLAGPSLCPV